MIEGTKKELIDDLQSRSQSFEKKSNIHRSHSAFFNTMFHLLGWPQVILTVAITSLNGSQPNDMTAFVLGLISSILVVSINFFRLNERGNRHHISALQWEELSLDVKTEKLDIENDIEDFDSLEKICTEKEKFIRAYEPPLCSNCIGRVLLKTVIK